MNTEFINQLSETIEGFINEMYFSNANIIARKVGKIVGDIIISIIVDKDVKSVVKGLKGLIKSDKLVTIINKIDNVDDTGKISDDTAKEISDDIDVEIRSNACITGGTSKSKWWHPGYVDNLTDSQILLGVKQSSKGLSTLGSATRSEALRAGEAWAGKGYKTITDNAGNIIGYSSSDGMRAFRIQYKPKERMWRANFQENYKYINEFGDITNKELKNVHIDILDK